MAKESCSAIGVTLVTYPRARNKLHSNGGLRNLIPSSLVPSRRDTNEKLQKHPQPGDQVNVHLHVGNTYRASFRLRWWRIGALIQPDSNTRSRGQLGTSPLW